MNSEYRYTGPGLTRSIQGSSRRCRVAAAILTLLAFVTISLSLFGQPWWCFLSLGISVLFGPFAVLTLLTQRRVLSQLTRSARGERVTLDQEFVSWFDELGRLRLKARADQVLSVSERTLVRIDLSGTRQCQVETALGQIAFTENIQGYAELARRLRDLQSSTRHPMVFPRRDPFAVGLAVFSALLTAALDAAIAPQFRFSTKAQVAATTVCAAALLLFSGAALWQLVVTIRRDRFERIVIDDDAIRFYDHRRRNAWAVPLALLANSRLESKRWGDWYSLFRLNCGREVFDWDSLYLDVFELQDFIEKRTFQPCKGNSNSIARS